MSRQGGAYGFRRHQAHVRAEAPWADISMRFHKGQALGRMGAPSTSIGFGKGGVLQGARWRSSWIE